MGSVSRVGTCVRSGKGVLQLQETPSEAAESDMSWDQEEGQGSEVRFQSS